MKLRCACFLNILVGGKSKGRFNPIPTGRKGGRCSCVTWESDIYRKIREDVESEEMEKEEKREPLLFTLKSAAPAEHLLPVLLQVES